MKPQMSEQVTAAVDEAVAMCEYLGVDPVEARQSLFSIANLLASYQKPESSLSRCPLAAFLPQVKGSQLSPAC